MVLWFYSNCSILNLAADEWRACQIAAVTQYKFSSHGFCLKRKNNLGSKIMNKNKNRYLFDFQNETMHLAFPTILFKTIMFN